MNNINRDMCRKCNGMGEVGGSNHVWHLLTLGLSALVERSISEEHHPNPKRQCSDCGGTGTH